MKRIRELLMGSDPADRVSTICKTAFICLTWFYFELVLKFSTTRLPVDVNLVYILLFSVCAGLGTSILVSVFPRKANRVLTPVVLAVIGLLYYAMYVSYREFLIFYDIRTISNGSGDALGQFMGETMRLVMSFNGILRLVLFLIPAICAIIFHRFLRTGHRWTWKPACIAAGLMLVVSLLSSGLIRLHPLYRHVYTDEYNFNAAVGTFGLQTAFRLDFQHSFLDQATTFDLEADWEDDWVSDTDDALVSDTENEDFPEDPDSSISEESFISADSETSEDSSDDLVSDTNEGTDDSSDTSVSDTKEEENSETVSDTIHYGKNRLKIDFEKIAEENGGTIRDLALYAGSRKASSKNEYTGMFEGKNLIFITCEALSDEVISEELTPTLYRLKTKGIQFTDYYQPASAGTTGGEFENIFGMLPAYGGGSMNNMTSRTPYTTIFYMLNELGYWGKAYHNNDFMYYDRNVTHPKLGFSEGFMGFGNGMEKYVDSAWPESDLQMMKGTVKEYLKKQPFCAYYMSVSGHSSYTNGGNDMAIKNRDRVEDLPYSDNVKNYLAANLELEDAMTHLVKKLEKKGIADDTVIVMTADHFPYGLDDDAALGHMPYLSELYGYEVTNYLQRDHNALIIWSGCLEDQDPIIVDDPTMSLDILPTLLNLFGLPFDSRLYAGRDVFSNASALVYNSNYDWKTDKGTYLASTGTFTPAEGVDVPEDYVEKMKKIVKNRITYGQGLQNVDFYGTVYQSIK